MADTRKISNGDILSLGSALDGLNLPDEQKTLLSAIIIVGGETLAGRSAPAPVVDGSDIAASFRQQFASSFKAGTPSEDGGVILKIGR